jgi:hypothetical protein
LTQLTDLAKVVAATSPHDLVRYLLAGRIVSIHSHSMG